MLVLWVLALCRLTGRRVCFSETSASTYKSTRRQNTEYHQQIILSSYYLDHNAKMQEFLWQGQFILLFGV